MKKDIFFSKNNNCHIFLFCFKKWFILEEFEKFLGFYLNSYSSKFIKSSKFISLQVKNKIV